MTDQLLQFKTKAEFMQSAFEHVAKVVSDHAMPSFDALTPAISAEKCLKHLATVAYDWSYDPSVIDAYAQVCSTANNDIIEAFGE